MFRIRINGFLTDEKERDDFNFRRELYSDKYYVFLHIILGMCLDVYVYECVFVCDCVGVYVCVWVRVWVTVTSRTHVCTVV